MQTHPEDAEQTVQAPGGLRLLRLLGAVMLQILAWQEQVALAFAPDCFQSQVRE
ncbi:hypothetical protein D3C72_2157670 [compost metagenome]